MCFMYQCLLNKCGFSYCQSWTRDIQNPRSVGLKKNAVYFHEQITPLGIEKEKKKANQQPRVAASREETFSPASLRRGERFFYLQLSLEQIRYSKHRLAMTIPQIFRTELQPHTLSCNFKTKGTHELKVAFPK